MDNFSEYIKQSEPSRYQKAETWRTAIGLQQVDGLTPSEYLIANARQNIEGDITIAEVKARLDSYYRASRRVDHQTEEADKVSARIAEILGEQTFSFSPAEFLEIHQRLFAVIYEFAGQIRDFNISKPEWVLGGQSVFYASASNLLETLEYDLNEEKAFRYQGLSDRQIVDHLADFIAALWQIHPFAEGNTRTVAVFLIKYLRRLGFTTVNNDLFARHSWYFRNALVRANFSDTPRKIYPSTKYLKRFLGNLLFNEANILKNRQMLITNRENDPVNDLVNDTVNQQILALVKINRNITIAELAKKTNRSESTIKRRLKSLKQTNQILRVGPDKTGYYQQIEKT